MFSQPATLELTHNWGTESDADFKGYHSGNDEPKGYGALLQSPELDVLAGSAPISSCPQMPCHSASLVLITSHVMPCLVRGMERCCNIPAVQSILDKYPVCLVWCHH